MLYAIDFSLLQLFSQDSDAFSIFVIFNCWEYFLLLLKIGNLFGPSVIFIKLLGNWLQQLDKFLSLLFFELIYMHMSCLLVVGHEFIPILCKFKVLYLLGFFNGYKFTMLSNSHVVSLSVLFFSSPASEYIFQITSHQIVLISFVLFAHLIY